MLKGDSLRKRSWNALGTFRVNHLWETKSITEKFPNGKHFLPITYEPVYNTYRKCWNNLKITILNLNLSTHFKFSRV